LYLARKRLSSLNKLFIVTEKESYIIIGEGTGSKSSDRSAGAKMTSRRRKTSNQLFLPFCFMIWSPPRVSTLKWNVTQQIRINSRPE